MILDLCKHTRLTSLLLTLSFILVWASAKAVEVPPFQAEGILIHKVFSVLQTNYMFEFEGRFVFSYNNNSWRVQFTYLNHYAADSSWPFSTGQMLDWRSIPEGIRKIILSPEDRNNPQLKDKLTQSFVSSELTPPRGQIEIFLPWLGLCPHYPGAFPSATILHETERELKLEYIQPENAFLSEVFITNNGSYPTQDGSMHKHPLAYQNGYVQVHYQVLETTNLAGTNFPKKIEIAQFTPCPPFKSPGDTWPVVVSSLFVQKLELNSSNSLFDDIPKHLVALDSRPTGLNNGLTVNHEVINDQWESITNNKIKRMADIIRHKPLNNVSNTRKRVLILGGMVVVALIPLCTFLSVKKQTKG